MRLRLPDRWVDVYLGQAPSLVWLLVVNTTAFLVGVAFYAAPDRPFGLALAAVPTFLYPFYADSPTALALATLSLATLLPNLGESPGGAPRNLPLAYLHTLAFVWLVKYGVWTIVALLVRPDLYVFGPEPLWAFWGIALTHALFVVEAGLLPRFGATTRGALLFALVAMLANDAADYLFGFYPPLRYEPGVVLVVLTVGISVLAVWFAARSFDRLDDGA